MKTWLVAGVTLIALSGCGSSPDAVGENSAGSIRTTAVGEVVANIATPTPTPTSENNATDAMSNDTPAAADAVAEVADNATTTH